MQVCKIFVGLLFVPKGTLFNKRNSGGLGAWVWKGRAGVWPIPLPSSLWLRAISISPPHTLAHLEDEGKNGYLPDESA